MAYLFFLVFFAQTLWANEVVLVVQAVSTDKTSFVVRRGAVEGIVPGQESLFTTKNVSLAATVVEITREHSLWKLSDPRGSVPFEKGDTLIFTNAIESLPLEISFRRSVLEEKKREEREEMERQPDPFGRTFLRSSFSYGFSETTGEISEASGDSTRTGLQLEGLYMLKLSSRFDLAFGLRFDRDTLIQENPALEIPTSRFFVVTESFFNFEGLNTYLGFGLAAGKSETEVGSLSVEGRALSFPTIRVGHRKSMGEKLALHTEAAFEYLLVEENFPGKILQETVILSGKLSFGISF